MTMGLLTRQQLAAINAAEDADYAHRHGRASDKFKPDAFELDRHTFMPNWTGLGTPGEIENTKRARREELFGTVFWILVAFALALFALHLVNMPGVKKPRPVDPRIQYQTKAARLAAGQSIYQLDSRGCLIGMHSDVAGIIHHTVVSEHC